MDKKYMIVDTQVTDNRGRVQNPRRAFPSKVFSTREEALLFAQSIWGKELLGINIESYE